MKKVENYTRTYLDLPPADNPPPFSMQEENQRSLLVISKIHNIILIGMNQNEDPPPSTQPNASRASNIAPPPYQSYEDR